MTYTERGRYRYKGIDGLVRLRRNAVYVCDVTMRDDVACRLTVVAHDPRTGLEMRVPYDSLRAFALDWRATERA